MSALIYCPFPDRQSARLAADTLLDKKLIACANIIGDVESIYDWNGERSVGTEVGVLFKTSKELLTETVGCMERIHPYDTPAVMGWCCDGASQATSEWLGALTGGK